MSTSANKRRKLLSVLCSSSSDEVKSQQGHRETERQRGQSPGHRSSGYSACGRPTAGWGWPACKNSCQQTRELQVRVTQGPWAHDKGSGFACVTAKACTVRNVIRATQTLKGVSTELDICQWFPSLTSNWKGSCQAQKSPAKK